MADYIFGVFFGFVLAFILAGAFSEFSPTSRLNVINNAINECQKELPRNVKCVITAVPEVKK